MFERLTPRARRVIVLAQVEARALKHAHVGTEHLLLGLVYEGEGVAAQALLEQGLSLDGVRADVKRIAGEGSVALAGEAPLTPGAERVIELAVSEAGSLEHEQVGTEHLLLALLAEQTGLAAQVLADRQITPAAVRTKVFELTGHQGRQGL